MTLVILLGLAIGGSGPAWHEWRARRRADRDRPLAQVHYLPPAAIRPPGWKP
jgi:hypothetical protein